MNKIMAEPEEQKDRNQAGAGEYHADIRDKEKDPLHAQDEHIIFHEDIEDDFDYQIAQDDDFDLE